MVMAADYPLMDVIWTMLVFFGWVMWFYLFFAAVSDLFRRHDVSGWGKAAWVLVMIFLPLIGVLIYVGVEGKGMAERNAKRQSAARADFDDYVKSVSGDGGPAGEIEKAKKLLDSGAITQAEFESLKAKALAH
jgi:hypothetical protein